MIQTSWELRTHLHAVLLKNDCDILVFIFVIKWDHSEEGHKSCISAKGSD